MKQIDVTRSFHEGRPSLTFTADLAAFQLGTGKLGLAIILDPGVPAVRVRKWVRLVVAAFVRSLPGERQEGLMEELDEPTWRKAQALAQGDYPAFREPPP